MEVGRRSFLAQTAAGAAALGLAGLERAAAAAGPNEPMAAPPVRMKVGHQHDHSPETLRLLAALGVEHICSGVPARHWGPAWSVEGLKKLRAEVESFGIRLDAVPLPMTSSPISR